MLTCKQASELISVQYGRALNQRERISLRLHLLMCRYCRTVARQIALIQKWAGWQGTAEPELLSQVCMPEGARERILAALADKTPPPKDIGPRRAEG